MIRLPEHHLPGSSLSNYTGLAFVYSTGLNPCNMWRAQKDNDVVSVFLVNALQKNTPRDCFFVQHVVSDSFRCETVWYDWRLQRSEQIDFVDEFSCTN